LVLVLPDQDRLWETVDAEWMECLRGEPVERLLMLPSGSVQAGPRILIFSNPGL
jgi:hypothetical protein